LNRCFPLPRCFCFVAAIAIVWSAAPLRAGWRVTVAGDQRQERPPKNLSGGTPIKPGDRWPTDQKFRWLIGDLEITERVGKELALDKAVGLQINCGDGGEVWLGNELQTRFDNDHPALVLITNKAMPGIPIQVVVQIYGKVQGGDKFDQANWVILDAKRAEGTLELSIDAQLPGEKVSNGLVGLSQGGGMSDYDDSTAQKLKAGGFKWFRMDNVFTGVLRKSKEGELSYNWNDFDKRIDFIAKIGADPIMAVSYMPQVLDAVPNNERQSAPNDYAAWEELCYQAAKHSLERGRRIPFWEVWNEVNTGWLKPGPDDTGAEPFASMYNEALGKEQTNKTTVRRFEAYCKLYRATAVGIRKADPEAKIGGPALASGPMENSECGHCSNGKGFARGLMLWCEHEKLPLDFVSWHEYFQEPQVIVKEANRFREYLAAFPALQKSAQSFMVTEWNEAWWPDRPQDHELGAAWCANTITRAFIPAHVDRPCFFYVKQGDSGFRGDYSLLMKDNVPKASYNVAKVFNALGGNWLPVRGGDEDISCVATWDELQAKVSVIMVNFRSRYAMRRNVRLQIAALPQELRSGKWREFVVDATHSNVWNDSHKPELTLTRSGTLEGAFQFEATLGPNSVTLLELAK